MRTDLCVLVALAATPVPAVWAQDPGFNWSRMVAPGKTIEVLNINGSIRAAPADDGAVAVTATRTSRRSPASSVRIEVVEHAGGVTICAVYPTPPGEEKENACRPGGGPMSVNRNDVTVNFDVRVPAGVRLEVHTVNGKVEAEQLGSDVEAQTVNGDVRIETSGTATARTVNGDVDVRMGRIARRARFEALNGDVGVAIPATAEAEFWANTFNGRIESDFEGTRTGRSGLLTLGRVLRGTIGAGGPKLEIKSFNGSVRLLRM